MAFVRLFRGSLVDFNFSEEGTALEVIHYGNWIIIDRFLYSDFLANLWPIAKDNWSVSIRGPCEHWWWYKN